MHIKYIRNKDAEVSKLLTNKNLPILVYGNGSIAKQVEIKLKKNNLFAAGRIVDDKHFLNHKGTFKSSECDSLFKCYVVIRGFFESYFMSDTELQSKFRNAKSFYYYSELYDMEGIDYNYFLKNEKEFQSFYNLLEDELSKKSYEAYLNSRINQDASYLLEYVSLPQYAPSMSFSNKTSLKKFMNFSDEKTWINCGAFDGDTIKSLIVDRGFVFKKVMAVEPDPKNAEKLHSFIAEQNLEDVVDIYECGLSDCISKTYFNSDGTAKASISNNSLEGFSIQLKKIDDIAQDREISFINMDIEGSEYSAIKGGVETIKKHKPKLAISVYHKKNDLLNIPVLIKSINSEYKFYFRIHKPITIDSVLYAI